MKNKTSKILLILFVLEIILVDTYFFKHHPEQFWQVMLYSLLLITLLFSTYYLTTKAFESLDSPFALPKTKHKPETSHPSARGSTTASEPETISSSKFIDEIIELEESYFENPAKKAGILFRTSQVFLILAALFPIIGMSIYILDLGDWHILLAGTGGAVLFLAATQALLKQYGNESSAMNRMLTRLLYLHHLKQILPLKHEMEKLERYDRRRATYQFAIDHLVQIVNRGIDKTENKEPEAQVSTLQLEQLSKIADSLKKLQS